MMAFVFSPFGRALGVLALALALTWGVYNAGQRAERTKCDAAAVRAELAAARADLDAARRAAQNAEALGHMLADLEKRNRELADEIDLLPGRCALSPDDARRLLSIR